jgi:hypothetical protein
MWIVNLFTLACQAEDRAHRIGQTDSVIIQYLVARGKCISSVPGILYHKALYRNVAPDLSH